VALSIPRGFAAHTTCYECHTPRARNAAGRDISSCATCHRLGRYARLPESAPAFRVNFSHAEHGARQQLDCRDCHAVRPGTTRARQVTSPAPQQHHASPAAQSCLTCHNNQRAFGGDDFADCKRCHEGATFRFQ
jgi:c(7)-type cytochrome triheme protein